MRIRADTQPHQLDPPPERWMAVYSLGPLGLLPSAAWPRPRLELPSSASAAATTTLFADGGDLLGRGSLGEPWPVLSEGGALKESTRAWGRAYAGAFGRQRALWWKQRASQQDAVRRPPAAFFDQAREVSMAAAPLQQGTGSTSLRPGQRQEPRGTPMGMAAATAANERAVAWRRLQEAHTVQPLSLVKAAFHLSELAQSKAPVQSHSDVGSRSEVYVLVKYAPVLYCATRGVAVNDAASQASAGQPAQAQAETAHKQEGLKTPKAEAAKRKKATNAASVDDAMAPKAAEDVKRPLPLPAAAAPAQDWVPGSAPAAVASASAIPVSAPAAPASAPAAPASASASASAALASAPAAPDQTYPAMASAETAAATRREPVETQAVPQVQRESQELAQERSPRSKPFERRRDLDVSGPRCAGTWAVTAPATTSEQGDGMFNLDEAVVRSADGATSAAAFFSQVSYRIGDLFADSAQSATTAPRILTWKSPPPTALPPPAPVAPHAGRTEQASARLRPPKARVLTRPAEHSSRTAPVDVSAEIAQISQRVGRLFQDDSPV